MTQHDGKEGSDREQDPPLDPLNAVDEIEERVVGRRTGDDEARPEDEGVNPVEDDDSGTGVDHESPG